MTKHITYYSAVKRHYSDASADFFMRLIRIAVDRLPKEIALDIFKSSAMRRCADASTLLLTVHSYAQKPNNKKAAKKEHI